MGHILAISNPKGGVGKTTTTINLGAALAEKGRRVLLIDLDPQGHLTINCGLNSIYSDDNYELASFILRGEVDKIKPFISKVEHFWVMPAHESLVRLQEELVVQRAGESRVRRIIELISSDYEISLIDSPPTISILSDAILLAAKKVLVPIQAEDSSIKGLEALEAQVAELMDILDTDIEIIGIVPNMVTTNSVSGRVLNSLVEKGSEETMQKQRKWASLVTDFQIRRRVALAKAQYDRKSIFSYDSRCDAIEGYRKLAEFIEQKMGMV